MAQIYISIGSNIEPKKYIRNSITALRQQYGQLQISSVYESEAVGFEGDNFYNLVVGAQTTDTPQQIQQTLRQIEHDNHRERNTAKFSARTLDLDLLLYDDWISKDESLDIPRDEIEKYAFVLQPLAEIAPHETHPQSKQTYQALWQTYDKNKQPLWIIDFELG
ncbi:2-amino-4-hydroxy-6-hydroxymethyldihydropteridine diphosphokinase [Candidatus Albibeggiatoa sp. nov. NOAA]|uniref:2-amino-4-hydroxy-6- hydroxymethyldihydropteridine diphosphokinase n=1 Tax=Candidatus Albibeggiatoa sp. nov. NOAA TaxID=3162724 RepID=UPI0032F1D772|nr:2-amino-4-hydroxy-6-hydroxymethyldihydropteridine diphosphokinase [Thiotrichaceae bacterium]